MKSVIYEILAGNSDAFREIVKAYDKQLLTMAFRYFHNWEDARDVTQTTFMKVFNNLKRFRTDQPFKPWIYKIHLNTCRSYYRKMKLRKSALAALFAGDPETADVGHAEGDLLIILRCVDRLTWKQKTAFTLMEIEGFSSEEAAGIMGCKPGTVRVHLNRARNNLQTKLRALGYSNE
ncbi:MAG: RNA polymerase sigma factor [FCB group bacterium]|nr:RNA polymerase sigma factor [FCB group bacterium]